MNQMNNKIVLITRPKYDDGTEYLCYYSLLIIKEAKKLGIDITDFEGEKANSENVEKFVRKKDPKLVLINGHGSSSSLEGHNGEIIFSIDKNIHLLKDKIVYARACHAGVNFGKVMVKDNEGCFIGYTTPFSFWIDDRYSATPSKDKTASLFLEPSNELMKFLINGDYTFRAHEKSKKFMIENMKKVLEMKNKEEPGAIGWLQVLWNNYEGQVLIGNSEANF